MYNSDYQNVLSFVINIISLAQNQNIFFLSLSENYTWTLIIL